MAYSSFPYFFSWVNVNNFFPKQIIEITENYSDENLLLNFNLKKKYNIVITLPRVKCMGEKLNVISALKDEEKENNMSLLNHMPKYFSFHSLCKKANICTNYQMRVNLISYFQLSTLKKFHGIL